MKSIDLTRGKLTFIDDEDFAHVSKLNWFSQKVGRRWYAACDLRSRGGAYILLHRFILSAPEGKEVDHKNGDGLDNRRDNLRICSVKNNRRAFRRKIIGCSSRFRGVRWHTLRNKWSAQIKTNGKQFYLGLFTDEVDAAIAYDTAAKKYFGEFASLNFR